jgi:hypothetical protein
MGWGTANSPVGVWDRRGAVGVLPAVAGVNRADIITVPPAVAGEAPADHQAVGDIIGVPAAVAGDPVVVTVIGVPAVAPAAVITGVPAVALPAVR